MVLWWFRRGPRVILSWSGVVLGWTNGVIPGIAHGWYYGGPELVLEWSAGGPELVLGWLRVGLQVVPG